ncbi:MAG TPA: ATP-binding cassette domain-containing protein, partial [Nevskiaceae bacterium]|nr:ATP-binding cassette domain-containing protein [Nevskiaceae bacterium]
LIQTFAGALAPLAGTSMRDPHLRIGYFAQASTQRLDTRATPLLHLRRLDPTTPEQKLRDYLGSFDFHGDRALEPVGNFSGGEQARLALALVAWQRPNLLLLDEPTNHLDLDMRHALETALLDYAGAVVLVSHDRHLVDSICETLWWVHEGRCEPFSGDVDDYAGALRGTAPAAASASGAKATASDADPQRAARRDRAGQRRLTKPLRDELQKLDKRMERLQRKLAELDAQLADPALYADHYAAAKASQAHGELKAQLNADEERWLAVSEQLEKAAAEA